MICQRIMCRPDWVTLSPQGARITVDLVPDLVGDTAFAEATEINVTILAQTLDAWLAVLVPGGRVTLTPVPTKLAWDIDCHPASSTVLQFLVQGLANLGHDGSDAVFFDAIRIDHPPMPGPGPSILMPLPAYGFCDARGIALQARDLPQYRGATMGMVVNAPAQGAERLARMLDRLSDCLESQCFIPVPDQTPRRGWLSSGLVEVADTGHLILRLDGCNGHPVEAQVFLACVAQVLGGWPDPNVVIFGEPEHTDD